MLYTDEVNKFGLNASNIVKTKPSYKTRNTFLSLYFCHIIKLTNIYEILLVYNNKLKLIYNNLFFVGQLLNISKQTQEKHAIKNSKIIIYGINIYLVK